MTTLALWPYSRSVGTWSKATITGYRTSRPDVVPAGDTCDTLPVSGCPVRSGSVMVAGREVGHVGLGEHGGDLGVADPTEHDEAGSARVLGAADRAADRQHSARDRSRDDRTGQLLLGLGQRELGVVDLLLRGEQRVAAAAAPVGAAVAAGRGTPAGAGPAAARTAGARTATGARAAAAR